MRACKTASPPPPPRRRPWTRCWPRKTPWSRKTCPRTKTQKQSPFPRRERAFLPQREWTTKPRPLPKMRTSKAASPPPPPRRRPWTRCWPRKIPWSRKTCPKTKTQNRARSPAGERAFLCSQGKFSQTLDKDPRLYYNNRAVRPAPVAQLDRVFGYEPKGRGFESLLARHVGAKSALLRRLFLPAAQKAAGRVAPLLLLPAKSLVCSGCSLASAVATPPLHYQLFADRGLSFKTLHPIRDHRLGGGRELFCPR